MLTIFIRTGLIPIFFHKSHTIRLNGVFLEGDCIVEIFYVRGQKVENLVGISAEYIDFYSWRIILAEKLAVPLSMDIVTDITTGEKGQQCQMP